MEDVIIELMACESVLLQEIGSKSAKQKGVALTYAMSLCSSEHRDGLIDWKKVNQAIVDRWGTGGLERIKKKAWNLIDEKCSQNRPVK